MLAAKVVIRWLRDLEAKGLAERLQDYPERALLLVGPADFTPSW
jgi:hypothetical protein